MAQHALTIEVFPRADGHVGFGIAGKVFAPGVHAIEVDDAGLDEIKAECDQVIDGKHRASPYMRIVPPPAPKPAPVAVKAPAASVVAKPAAAPAPAKEPPK